MRSMSLDIKSLFIQYNIMSKAVSVSNLKQTWVYFVPIADFIRTEFHGYGKHQSV